MTDHVREEQKAKVDPIVVYDWAVEANKGIRRRACSRQRDGPRGGTDDDASLLSAQRCRPAIDEAQCPANQLSLCCLFVIFFSFAVVDGGDLLLEKRKQRYKEKKKR